MEEVICIIQSSQRICYPLCLRYNKMHQISQAYGRSMSSPSLRPTEHRNRLYLRGVTLHAESAANKSTIGTAVLCCYSSNGGRKGILHREMINKLQMISRASKSMAVRCLRFAPNKKGEKALSNLEQHRLLRKKAH